MANSAGAPESSFLANSLAPAMLSSSEKLPYPIPSSIQPIVSVMSSASADKSVDDPPVERRTNFAPDGENVAFKSGDAPAEGVEPAEEAVTSEQVVLILVGLVGAGKSTFADALEREFPVFKRCCQDELGDRRMVENAAWRALQEGQSVCIDRTNFDKTQRAHWLNIASGHGVPARIIFFDTPYDVCVERLQLRRGHPTLPNVQAALSVLRRFSSSFEPPHSSEGYDSLLRLAPEDCSSIDYTRDELLQILCRVRAAPAESEHERQRQHIQNRGRRESAGYMRGRGAYGGRGNDYYRADYNGRGRRGERGWSPARGGRSTYDSPGPTSGGWRTRASPAHEYQRGFDRGGFSSAHAPSRGSFAAHTTNGREENNGYRGATSRGGGTNNASSSRRGTWREASW